MKVTKPLFSFFAWCIREYVVRYGVKPIPVPVVKSLEFLEQSRDQVGRHPKYMLTHKASLQSFVDLDVVLEDVG